MIDSKTRRPTTLRVTLQAPAEAQKLLVVCRRFWGQPYVVSIYTLLLHQWLMIDPTAGGVDERQKHLNVLVAGT